MADIETIKIPELVEAATLEPTDQIIVRQGFLEKRASISTLNAVFNQGATLSRPGIVQLNNTVTSTSIDQAGTANSVRLAYNRGTDGVNAAANALSVANSKANIVHTHDGSQITTGKIYWERLPLGTMSDHGVVRIDSFTARGVSNAQSSGGYAPSVERVNTLNNWCQEIQNQIASIVVGQGLMPAPLEVSDMWTLDFPIGQYLLCNAGIGNFGRRQQIGGTTGSGRTFGISLEDVRAPGSGNFANLPGYEGRYSLYDLSAESLIPVNRRVRGLWRMQGAVGGQLGSGAPVSILCQRIT